MKQTSQKSLTWFWVVGALFGQQEEEILAGVLSEQLPVGQTKVND